MRNLIDDCLVYILACLPLSDLLLRIQLVCHRWKSLVKCVSARKRSIKLHHKYGHYCVLHQQYDNVHFWRERYFKRNPFEVLVVGDLTIIRLEFIMKTFANITSLEFRQINPQAMHCLIALLHKWPKLRTLKLFVGKSTYVSTTTSQEWNYWLEHISRTLSPSLRHLVFYERAQHVFARIRLPANFCPQLESLHVGLLFEEANISMSQISQLASLHTFGFIPFHSYNNHQYKEVRDQHKRVLLTRFTSPLRELMLAGEFDCATRDWAIQATFYLNFQTLTQLSLRLSQPLHWFMLDSGLHNLTNLAYLNVQNCFADCTDIGIRHRRQLWTVKPDPSPRYTSLRTLHLAHVPCYAFNWAVNVLPNIETLQMDQNILTEGWEYSTYSSGSNTFASLSLLIGCTKLRQVIYRGLVYPTEPELKIVYHKYTKK